MKRIFLAAALTLDASSLDASAQRKGFSEEKSFALVHAAIVGAGGARHVLRP